jgi:hypothetical protein
VAVAAFVAAVVADELLVPSGVYQLPCLGPGEFWSLFERCKPPWGEHLFEVAAITAITGAIVAMLTRRLTRKKPMTVWMPRPIATRVRDISQGAAVVGLGMVVSSLFGLNPPQRTAFSLLLTGVLLIGLAAPGLVSERARGPVLIGSLGVVLFTLVVFSGLFTETLVS